MKMKLNVTTCAFLALLLIAVVSVGAFTSSADDSAANNTMLRDLDSDTESPRVVGGCILNTIYNNFFPESEWLYDGAIRQMSVHLPPAVLDELTERS